MKLLSNSDIKNHKTEILKAIKDAEEIIFCTAFLKYSGLKSLLDELNKRDFKVTFYVGTNFYQTEPVALKHLFKDGHTIYLNRNISPTFHPKIFYFRNLEIVKLFIGSANLTSGGLESNIESSIEFETTTNTLLHLELNEQLLFFKTKSLKIDSLETILDYENRYKIYREKHKKADFEFKKQEEIIIENERKRDEERLRKIEEEKKKRKQSTNSNNPKNRFVITDEYKESWKVDFEKFKSFKINNGGNTIIPKTNELYSWYKKQRDFYNHKDENGVRVILPEHLALLNKENFFWGNPNEIQWMLKWENKLMRVDAYCKTKKLGYAWVTVDKKNKENPLNDLAQWCMDQRLRLEQLKNEKNYKTKKRKITEYEIKRLEDIKFLITSDELTRQTNELTILERLIQIETYKKEELAKGSRKWLPSQTDKDPKINDLGNWLNDKIESIKEEKKDGNQREITSEVEGQFIDLGINIEYGITGSYFDYNVKEYLKMREKFPNDFPSGEERKKYKADIQWAITNKSKFHTYPEWRQIRLREIGIVKKPEQLT